jgi:hypothetical protein
VVAAVIAGRAVGAIAPAQPVGDAGATAAGSSAASSAAQRRAATRPSVIEFDASRLAPCTPVQATSPTA